MDRWTDGHCNHPRKFHCWLSFIFLFFFFYFLKYSYDWICVHIQSVCVAYLKCQYSVLSLFDKFFKFVNLLKFNEAFFIFCLYFILIFLLCFIWFDKWIVCFKFSIPIISEYSIFYLTAKQEVVKNVWLTFVHLKNVLFLSFCIFL